MKALEKIAVDMPEVCIMNPMIFSAGSATFTSDHTLNYFSLIPAKINVKRCGNIISKSGEKLGEYDFFFEWFKDPTMDELNNLIEKIDEALAPLGSRYAITTK